MPSPKSLAVVSSLLLASVCAGGAESGDWPMWRHDANRSAASPAELPAQLHLQWTRELPAPRPAFPSDVRLCFDRSYEPVVMGRTMFVPSMVSDSVSAMDTATGAEKWRFYADGPIRFAPVAWQGKVYFVSDDGRLYCLDARTGRLLWKFCGVSPDREAHKVLGDERLISRWPARGGPVLADGTIYFAAGWWPNEGVYVHAVNAGTGRRVWTNERCSFIKDGLLDHGGRWDVGLSPQGYLTAVGGRVIVPNGRALPAYFDAKSGEMEPYTTGWGGRVALAKGCWYASASGDYVFQSGEVYGLTPQIASRYGAYKPQESYRVRDFAELADVPLARVEQWVEKGLLKTVERDGERLVRLHVPKSSTYMSWWMGSLRKGEEHALRTRPRLQPGPANFKELGVFREPVLTEHAVYYSRPAKNVRGGGSHWPPALSYREIVAYDLRSPKWRVTCTDGYSGGPCVFTWKSVAFDQLWSLPSELKVYIKAGGRLYAGAQGVVAAVDIPKPGGAAKVSWQTAIKGTPSSMLAADGKLFVVTEEGSIYCFGERAAQPTVHALAKPTAASADDEWTATVGQILKAAGDDQGYCLAFGLGTGRLVEELTRQSRAHIVVIDPDVSKVAAARRKLDRSGLHGTRVHILAGDLATVELPPYLASLVVSEGFEWLGLREGRASVGKLFRALRPYGGVACLPLPQDKQAILVGRVKAAQLPAAEVERIGDLTLLRRAGPLPGSADWTHPKASAANTSASTDQLVKPPFGVLWFGGSVDTVFPSWDYTHRKYPTPLVVGGRMFIQIGNVLHVADVYTGRRLWKATLPAPKVKRIGYIYAAAKDGVYVACDETCLRLDPATGAELGRIGVPTRMGKAATWSDIRLHRGSLIGSTGKSLVCIDRATGKERWSFECRHRLLSFAVGGDRVFCADCSIPDRRGKVTKTEGRLLGLDVTTGALAWETPIEQEGGRRVIPQLAYAEGKDVLIAVGEAVRAYQGASGAVLWEKRIPGCNPCMVHRDLLITQEGELFDLLTGSRRPQRLWQGAPNRGLRGCNTAIAGEHLVAIRDAHVSYFDLATYCQTSFRCIRSGCTNNLVLANGLLNAPNFAHGCSCNWPVFTSFAMAPMPEATTWAIGDEEIEKETSLTASAGSTVTLSVTVRNRLRTRTRGAVALDVPDGWLVQPKTREVVVQGKSSVRCDFQVKVPAHETGANRLVRIKQRSPHLLVEPSLVRVSVCRPLEIEIKTELDRELKIVLHIRNQQSESCHGLVKILVPEQWKVTPTQFALKALRPGEERKLVFTAALPSRPSDRRGRIEVTVESNGLVMARTVQGPVVAPRTSTRPTIDGKLDEPCWQHAAQATDFVSGTTGSPVEEQTTVWVTYDDAALYLGMRCSDTQPRSLKADAKQHDGPVWMDDSVEVFLDVNHNRRTYFQLIANAIGTTFDGVGRQAKWDCHWTAKTSVRDDCWLVEMCIPFKSLAVSAPKPGDIWGVNFTRSLRGKKVSQLFCTRGNNHRPDLFGQMAFSE